MWMTDGLKTLKQNLLSVQNFEIQKYKSKSIVF